jgi:hypothetical protein
MKLETKPSVLSSPIASFSLKGLSKHLQDPIETLEEGIPTQDKNWENGHKTAKKPHPKNLLGGNCWH